MCIIIVILGVSALSCDTDYGCKDGGLVLDYILLLLTLSNCQERSEGISEMDVTLAKEEVGLIIGLFPTCQ